MVNAADGERGGEPLDMLVGPAAPAVGAENLAAPAAELAPAPASAALFLELGDLLPDAAGEVVLFAGEAAVSLHAETPLVEAGFAPAHVTASGLDVTGLHFCSFEGGITVYSPSDILVVGDEPALG